MTIATAVKIFLLILCKVCALEGSSNYKSKGSKTKCHLTEYFFTIAFDKKLQQKKRWLWNFQKQVRCYRWFLAILYFSAEGCRRTRLVPGASISWGGTIPTLGPPQPLANHGIIPCQSEHLSLPIWASFLTIRASFLANLSIIHCKLKHRSLPIWASFLANQSIIPCKSEHHFLPIRESFLANLSIIPCQSEHHSLPIRTSFLANLSISSCQSEHHSMLAWASFLATLSIIPCQSEHLSLPIWASFLANLSIMLCQSEQHFLPI